MARTERPPALSCLLADKHNRYRKTDLDSKKSMWTAFALLMLAMAVIQFVPSAPVIIPAGLPPEQVAIHTVWAGGSFGRRAVPNSDYIAEAAARYER